MADKFVRNKNDASIIERFVDTGGGSWARFVVLGGGATVIPLFTTGPVLVGTPTAGTAMTPTAGVYNGGAGTTVVRTWYVNGRYAATSASYTPALADIGKGLTCREKATNTLGVDHSSSTYAIVVQGAGDPIYTVLPFLESYDPTVGLKIRCNHGTQTGTAVTQTFQWKSGAANALGLGATTDTYTPALGDIGAVITCATTLTGTNGTYTYTTPGYAAVALTTPTGVWRAGSACNRMSSTSLTPSATTARKIGTNNHHYIGSGNQSEISFVMNNIYAPSTNTTVVGPGNSVTFDQIRAVYNGVNVAVTFAGATSLTLTDGQTDVQSDSLLASAFGATEFVQGDLVVLHIVTDVPINARIPGVLNGDAVGFINEHLVYDPSVKTLQNITAVADMYVSGVTQGAIGPTSLLLGKYISGDPRVTLGVGDSIFDLSSSFSIYASYALLCVGQPKMSGVNIAKTGGTSGIFRTSLPWQNLMKYGNIGIDEFNINSASGGNVNATDLIAASTDVWAKMNAAANNTAPLRPFKIVRTSLMFNFNSAPTFSNTLSSLQTPFTRFLPNGDVELSYVPWCLARVADSSIAAYCDYKPRYSLSQVRTDVNFFKCVQSTFSDRLHPGQATWAGQDLRDTVMSL